MPERKNWHQRREKEEGLQCVIAAVSYSHRTVISSEKDQVLTCVCNTWAWGLDFILKEKKEKSRFGNKNEGFLALRNREDKAAQASNPPKSTPQSSSLPPCQAHTHICSYQTCHGRNTLTGLAKLGHPLSTTPAGIQARSPAGIS